MIDIAIIGGGPAGLSAGLYAARGGAEAVLFEEIFVGGQAAKTERIDNYPGFEEGIDGGELTMRMERQASRFGLKLQYEPVMELSLKGTVKRIRLPKGEVEARAVILCMGASPRPLGVDREEALVGKGISYCATCDGAFFRNRDVAVVGGGDTALNDALYLARFASKVTLIHRRDALRGSPVLQKAVFDEPKIELAWSSVVEALEGEDRLESIAVRQVVTGEKQSIPTAALFVAVGTLPRTDLVKEELQLTSGGYIQTDSYMRTSLPGVYAAGDIRETPLRQVVTAAADGAVAATQALEELSGI